MYGFVTHTWNPIKGKCSHDCGYCYMKVYPQKPLHLVERELLDDLGSGNFIFVGSSTDMFANDVPKEWILKVLEHCRKYPSNTFLFQTKNTQRVKFLVNENYNYEIFPRCHIIGVTLESDRDFNLSEAPKIEERINGLMQYTRKMVSIEPILSFNLSNFVAIIKRIKPEFVSIGADSKGHHLPEPSADKVLKLIHELKMFTEVRIKDNLKRIIEVCPACGNLKKECICTEDDIDEYKHELLLKQQDKQGELD